MDSLFNFVYDLIYVLSIPLYVAFIGFLYMCPRGFGDSFIINVIYC